MESGFCQGLEKPCQIKGLGMIAFGDPSIATDPSISGDHSLAGDPSSPVDMGIVVDHSIPEDLSIAGDPSSPVDLSIVVDHSVAEDPSISKDPSISEDLSISKDPSIAGDPSITGDLSIPVDHSIRPNVGSLSHSGGISDPTTTIGMLMSLDWAEAEIEGYLRRQQRLEVLKVVQASHAVPIGAGEFHAAIEVTSEIHAMAEAEVAKVREKGLGRLVHLCLLVFDHVLSIGWNQAFGKGENCPIRSMA